VISTSSSPGPYLGDFSEGLIGCQWHQSTRPASPNFPMIPMIPEILGYHDSRNDWVSRSNSSKRRAELLRSFFFQVHRGPVPFIVTVIIVTVIF
jgi:hypothetical protein